MRQVLIGVAVLGALAGCSFFQKPPQYTVFFPPYSADLSDQARQSVQAAASYALAHSTQPVFVVGYSAPPDPGKDVDGLSAQRADVVEKALRDDGVSLDRIVTESNGITDPGNMPQVSVRRVDIRFER
jgi:outer membrane protein OmpA-like peptidoglycan-associated protein